MDHVRAQQLISEALDGLAVDRFELVEAKDHCRECTECAAYVRALIAVQRTPLPEPPADLVDRVMDRVRAEAQQRSETREQSPSAPSSRRESLPADTKRATTFAELWSKVRDPRNRPQVVLWGTTAAMLFIVAGWSAVLGVRAILVPTKVTEITITGTDTTAGQQYSATIPESERSGEAPSESGASDALSKGPDLIEVSGAVYRSVGMNPSIDIRDLKEIGRTKTSFSGTRPQTYDVLAGADPLRIYVEADSGIYEFLAVTREFEGATYILQSGPIERFGDWPSLPNGMSTPATADGSPTFKQYGADTAGLAIYVLASGSPTDGIALAPSPPATDAIAGCPNWTWWAPFR